MMTNTNLNWCYVFLLFIVAVLVYLPGLPGGFIYDDYYNFLQNSTINDSELSLSSAWSATLSGSSGPLGRPLAMLSFYLNYQLSGFSPLSYKLVNIAIHGLNTVLVFFITCRLLNLFVNLGCLSGDKRKIELLAFWVTILWAVHPINLTAVLYVVQRMTSMSATFTLLGIYYYLNLRENSSSNIKMMITRLSLIILLGVSAALCKENGLLLFLFLFLIECFLFQWHVDTVQESWCLKVFYIFVLVLPLCFAGIMLLNGDLTENYSSRTFDLTQRMLTEFRVLWFYIFQIILPQANLFGLYHDDFILSINLIDPVSTVWSIIAFILLIVFTIRYTRKISWFGFGLTFFFAGHLMESTILPLNLVHEHRNYLPSLGIIIIFVLLMNLILSRVKVVRINLVFVVITLLFAVITINRAHDWSDVVLLGERLAQRHPDSVTSNYEMGYIYAKVYEQTHDPVFANTAKIALKKAVSLSDSNMQPAISLAHVRAMLGEAEDQDLIKKIAMDFRHGRTSVIEVISLRQLVNCHIEGICKVSNTMMQTLFSSLFANHGLRYRQRDDALYIYATYLMTIPEGVAQALTIMQEIVLRNPDILQYQVKLISVLLTNEKVNEANLLMDKLTQRYGIKWNVVTK
jgi:protein O-mannosyl-transferase